MNPLIFVFLTLGAGAPPVSPPPEALKHFESLVRPLLVEKCQKCHGPTRQRGGLRLDSLERVLTGGENGPAIVPGDHLKSRLIRMVHGEFKAMPPDNPLMPREIAALEKWVRDGAAWPKPPGLAKKDSSSESLPLRKPGPIHPEERQWWTFLQVQPRTPPQELKQKDWAKTEIDRFLLSRMEAAGITPAPRASPEDQIRRITLALTGLPPSPEEIDAWEADHSDAAYQRLVERLLESRQHAEAWAVRWLDLVRYADSDGYRIDHERPNAWRYRDYVIDSFHENRPVNRFLQEQIAGDELFPKDSRARVATAFLRNGIYEYNNRDARGQWNVILNDITDTVGDAFLGLGFQCARCHDHKYDPILQVDYFRLRAFFSNILPREEVLLADTATQKDFAIRKAEWESKTRSLSEKIAALEKPFRESITKTAVERFPPDIQAMINKDPKSRAPLETQIAELCWRQVDYDLLSLDTKFKGQAKEELLTLKRELARFDSIRPKPLPSVHAIVETGIQAPATLHPKNSKEDVLPGFLTLLDPLPASIASTSHSSGRRSALAQWMTRDDNPLTARVFVNRVWAWHMGRGIAPQPSDTGRLGSQPTHPELLDWLTDRFVKSGWNLRELHKLIVLSAFYQQSSLPKNEMVVQVDPDNRLYTRHISRRLTAEEIRDAMFQVTGEMKPAHGGPGNDSGSSCRAVYLKVLRNSRHPFLDVFDLPQGITSTAMRDSTTTALQSLLLWNSPQMIDRSRAMAVRLSRETVDPRAKVVRAWKLALSRAPTESELNRTLDFLKRQEKIASDLAMDQVVRIPVERMPHHEGQAVNFSVNPPGPLLESPWDSLAESEDFTVELFFLARTVSETGTVRTLVSRHDGNSDHAGWSLGITGKQSRRKPQTLVLQMFASQDKEKPREIPVFSDQKVELNHPYQLAVSVRRAKGGEKGKVRFYLRDLSNPDEPAQETTMEWSGKESLESTLPMRIGSRFGAAGVIDAPFDGLIDDVRISRGFFSTPGGGVGMATTGIQTGGSELGRWTFEAQTGMLKDLSGKGHDLKTARQARQSDTPALVALTDLCHVLFNSSGFLYVP